MRKKLIGIAMLLGTACLSGPSPKQPDEGRRVPVNRVPPPEVKRERAPEKSPRTERPDGGAVEWR